MLGGKDKKKLLPEIFKKQWHFDPQKERAEEEGNWSFRLRL